MMKIISETLNKKKPNFSYLPIFLSDILSPTYHIFCYIYMWAYICIRTYSMNNLLKNQWVLPYLFTVLYR